MNENPKAGKTRRFFEEKGFYIILFLCAAAIGIAGYVLFAQPFRDTAADGIDDVPPDLSAIADLPKTTLPALESIEPKPLDEAEVYVPEDEADLPVSDHPAEEEVSAEITAEPKPEAAAEVSAPKEPEAVETVKRKEEPAKEPTFFVKPVNGEILKEFNVTELLYDRTMGDWRTHNGIDLAANNGQLVGAMADGSVVGVYNDEYYGTCVRVEHGGGLVSVYYGLAKNATVKVGDTVKAGDTVGAVSTDTLFESLEPVHLHLEVTRDGEYVNPAELLPQ